MAQTRRASADVATPRRRRPAKIGLALAGGGPLGAIYEIGALCALEESLEGISLTELDGYVGVSAGALIAAGLANGMTAREQCAAMIENTGLEGDILDPSLLMRPAWSEFAQRLLALPKLAAQAGWDMTVRGRSKLAALERLGRVMPTGVLSGDALERQLAKVYGAVGRTNDFRLLKRRLVLVATDLDSGESAPFGMKGFDHVPISVAVQASAALPGLFPPVTIDGRSYVDGALKKTVHASVLLDEGIDLLLCLNPLVPFDASSADPRLVGRANDPIPRMVDGGLPLVLSQTFRSLIHSRLALGMKGYESSHPNTDILLFEPDHRDSALFVANTFSVSQRRALAEHAYQRTRETLRARRGSLTQKLRRHGVTLNEAALSDRTRRLITPPKATTRNPRTADALRHLDDMLQDLEDRLGIKPGGATASPLVR
jgi:predicted acylesterase/phospholipase RssA